MQPNGLPGSEGSIMPTTGKGTLNTIKNSVIAALGAITLSQSTPSQAAPLIPLE